MVPGRDYRLTNNTTTFVVDAPASGVAVLTEAYQAGDFIVGVNGRRSDYFRVNHAFRGVKIPTAGTYVISFSYWPRYFGISLWMAAAGSMPPAGWLILALRKKMPGPRLLDNERTDNVKGTQRIGEPSDAAHKELWTLYQEKRRK